VLLLGALALCATSFPASSHAQPASRRPGEAASAAEADRARELYRDGDKAFRAGRFEEARTAFLAAWSLKKHWQVAATLGDTELRTKRYRDAAEHITFALREGGASMSAAQVQNLRKALEEAKRHVGEVKLEVTPADADVTVDGALIGLSPLTDPAFLEPGAHVVEAKKLGHVARRESVEARAGAVTSLRVELAAEGAVTPPGTTPPPPGAAVVPPPEPTSAPPMLPPEETEGGGKSVPLIVAGASLGAIGVGVGIGLLVASSSAAADRDALVGDLPAPNACAPGSPLAQCDEIDGLDGDARTFRGVGVAALAVGGGFAVATLVYALWPEDRAVGETAATRVAPYASPTGAGFSIQSTF